MMRGLLILIFLVVIYYALKAVFRSAVRSYHEEDRKRVRIMGEDMVQDPECRTYVPKGRTVVRRIGDTQRYFCSEECAKRYEERHGT